MSIGRSAILFFSNVRHLITPASFFPTSAAELL